MTNPWKTSVCRRLLPALLFAILAMGQKSKAQQAAQDAAKPATNGEQKLEEGRSTLEESTLMSASKLFEECIRQDSQNFACYYQLARTDAYLEKVKVQQKDKKAAERWLDSAIGNAKRATALKDGSSDAHALLGELYGEKIGFGGMFTGMQLGPKANAETQRAFQLDANNPRAFTTIGHKYLFAPKMFGGDLDKAVESFQKATVLDPHYDEAFVWLAIAYRRKGDEPHARTAVEEALRLNPKSTFARRIQSGEK
jgi:tetratricopeptide (TPR) repeat protein